MTSGFGDTLEEAFAHAGQPSTGELIAVRSVVLETLGYGSANTLQLVEAWLARLGIVPDYPNSIDLGQTALPLDRDHPYLEVVRGRNSVRQVLAGTPTCGSWASRYVLWAAVSTTVTCAVRKSRWARLVNVDGSSDACVGAVAVGIAPATGARREMVTATPSGTAAARPTSRPSPLMTLPRDRG
jgi:hypothetical protein